MSTKIVDIPSVGPVSIVKSQRAKYIRITIKPDQSVRLTVPRGESFNKSIQFLHSKIPWITKHQRRFSRLENAATNTQQREINERQVIETIINRLEELAELYKFKYTRATIRNQKTKWGSCSAKNNISLNINLIRLPDQLRDYVILHELVHTRFKNHSKKFWAELDKFVGGRAKELSKELKKYQLRGTI
jgi:predicted metal-dependent hydrolase